MGDDLNNLAPGPPGHAHGDWRRMPYSPTTHVVSSPVTACTRETSLSVQLSFVMVLVTSSLACAGVVRRVLRRVLSTVVWYTGTSPTMPVPTASLRDARGFASGEGAGSTLTKSTIMCRPSPDVRAESEALLLQADVRFSGNLLLGNDV